MNLKASDGGRLGISKKNSHAPFRYVPNVSFDQPSTLLRIVTTWLGANREVSNRIFRRGCGAAMMARGRTSSGGCGPMNVSPVPLR
jgi:hypothetical protein